MDANYSNFLEHPEDVSGSAKNALPIFQPDFSFLMSMGMRADQQYEQGLNQIKSTYNTVFNQPTLGEAAKNKQEQYKKEAQEQMKAVSATDLSDPKNVFTAEQIMTPYLGDKDLTANQSYAKYYNEQNSTLDSWEHSTDKEVRGQYNDNSRRDLINRMDEIAKAPLDRNIYAKFTKAEATPYYDINAEINKDWADTYGKSKDGEPTGISYVTTDGKGEQITHHGGLKTKEAYQTYYLSLLASGKYDAQIKVDARVQNDYTRKQILLNNPGLDEKTLNTKFAEKTRTDLGNAYSNQAKNYRDQANYFAQYDADGNVIGGELKKLYDIINTQQGGILKEGDDKKIIALTQAAQERKIEADKYQNEYQDKYSPTTINGTANPNYDKILKDIAFSPDDYQYKVNRLAMADIWASGRAAVTSEDRIADPVRAQQLDAADKHTKNLLESQKIGVEQQGHILGYREKTGRNEKTGELLDGFDPNSEHGWYGESYGQGGKEGQNQTASQGDITGWFTMQPANITADMIVKDQENSRQTLNNTILNPDKGTYLHTLLSGFGMSSSDIIDFSEATKNMLNGKPLTKDSKSLAVFMTVKQKLAEYGITTPINNADDMRNALLDYGPKRVEYLKKNGTIDEKKLITPLVVQMNLVDGQRDAYVRSSKNIEKAMDEILKDEVFEKIRVQNPNGSYRMMNKEDVAKTIPFTDIAIVPHSLIRTTLKENDNRIQHLNSDEIAKMWMRGDFTEGKQHWTGRGDLEINGNGFDIVFAKKPNGQIVGSKNEAEHVLDYQNTTTIGGTTQKTGKLPNPVMTELKEFMFDKITSKEFQKLSNEATTKSVTGMTKYANGIIAPIQSWKTYETTGMSKADKSKVEFAQHLAPELAEVSNTNGFYTIANDGTHIPLGDTHIEWKAANSNFSGIGNEGLLRTALKGNLKDNGIENIQKTRDNNNDAVYAITFSSNTGVKDKNPGMFDNQIVYLKVDPNATGKYMKSIVENTGQYVYSGMYDGETSQSSPTVQATGINVTTKPYAKINGKNTQVLMTVERSIPNPNDSTKNIKLPTIEQTYPIGGESAYKKTPDEVMADKTIVENNHAIHVVNNYKTAELNRKSTGKKLSDFQKELKQN